MEREGKIDITPEVEIYGTWRSLNYNFFNAISEYIDNSINNFLINQDFFLSKKNFFFEIHIDIDHKKNQIIIFDNGTGMNSEELSNAMKPARKPKKILLSEYGMGMKTASCWFSEVWLLMTKKYNENKEYYLSFDLKNILENNKKEIDLNYVSKNGEEHYTKLVLLNPKTLYKKESSYYKEFKEKVKEKYNNYLKKYKNMRIFIDGEKLENENLEVWETTSNKTNRKTKWEKEIEFNVKDKKIKGKALILKSDDPVKAGLYLFRTDRLIEKIKPTKIYGNSQGNKSQRLYIELHMDSFKVSQSKDKIDFGHDLQIFEENLKDSLKKDLNILTQANRNKNSKEFNGNHPVNKKKVSQNKKAPIKETEEINIRDHFDEKPKKEITGDINNFSEIMASCFKEFFILENYLRSKILSELKFDDFKFIKKDEKTFEKIIEGRKKDDFLRKLTIKEDLYFLDFIDLSKIIINNWDIFREKYGNKKSFKEFIHLFNEYRKVIYHNCVLQTDQIEEFKKFIKTFLEK